VGRGFGAQNGHEAVLDRLAGLLFPKTNRRRDFLLVQQLRRRFDQVHRQPRHLRPETHFPKPTAHAEAGNGFVGLESEGLEEVLHLNEVKTRNEK